MKTQPAFLILRGNFTQRQFDALGRIWDNLQRGNRTDWTLPAIQIQKEANIGLIKIKKNGKVKMKQLFSDKE